MNKEDIPFPRAKIGDIIIAHVEDMPDFNGTYQMILQGAEFGHIEDVNAEDKYYWRYYVKCPCSDIYPKHPECCDHPGILEDKNILVNLSDSRAFQFLP